ncbi:hypothetical protein ACLVWU_08120 [Bdellovibrio sp. HCB290]|uniref:hypothetical protein n=1 Tax=Bdellovibrio sp. HCB290 TaxID=3394356 RepID=UPI0039B38B07
MKRIVQYIPYILLSIIALFFIRNLGNPLQGMHFVRQSDTLMTGVIYCYESAPFLEPRIAFRGALPKGVVRGEFPLFSYIVSLPCKATGVWSYVFPKILAYSCFLIALLFWVRMLFPDNKEKQKIFATLSVAISAIVTYMLIPIPDAMVFLFFSGSAALFRVKSERSWLKVLLNLMGFTLISVGFAMRPYFIFLIPYLFLITKDRRFIYSLLPSAGIYFWWYKTMVPTSDILNYYYTGMPTLEHMFSDFLPSLASGVFPFLRDQFEIFGLIFLFYGIRKNKIVAIYGLVVLLVMYFLRGSHLSAHQYYIVSATLIGLHLMTEGAIQISKSKRALILTLMILVLIASDQHHWHKPNVNFEAVRRDAEQNSRFENRICMKNFGLSAGFYYALRTGWADSWSGFIVDTFPRIEMADSSVEYKCPKGAYIMDQNNYLTN